MRGKPTWSTELDPNELYPTHGPGNRFGAILFIEKEGFLPWFVLRDFDKAGFSIAGTLSRDNDRYQFEHSVQVIDLGLRLEDVNESGLGSESFHIKADTESMKRNLRFAQHTLEPTDARSMAIEELPSSHGNFKRVKKFLFR